MNTLKHTFFCANFDDGFLSPEESNHAVRVLRLSIGQAITLINGKGGTAQATITNAHKKQLEFSIVSSSAIPARKGSIHIVIAPTKNIDRFNFFIEKTIEIGIDRITPVFTKNSERKQLNIEKIRKAAVGALKQSGNLFLPEIDEPVTFNQFMENWQDDQSQCFLAHCEDDNDKQELKNLADPEKKVIILIGPEGDFTPEEIKLAKQKHFKPVSLGKTRLRTETAGIVACHTIHVILP